MLTILRANIHGGVDGIKTGSNVLIQDLYIHGMQWFASDPRTRGVVSHQQ